MMSMPKTLHTLTIDIHCILMCLVVYSVGDGDTCMTYAVFMI